MAGIGVPQDRIAAALGIDTDTMRKHFRIELTDGRTRTLTKVADSLVRQALAGNVTAAIFYLKTQGRWREAPQEHEHAGPGGGPIEVANIQMTDAERAERVTRLLERGRQG